MNFRRRIASAEHLETRYLLAFDFELNVRPPDIGPDSGFGNAVDIHDGIAVIGAPHADKDGANAGAAYVLDANAAARSSDASAELIALEPPPSLRPGSRFGNSVAIFDDTIVVGAFLHDQQGEAAGAAYVYERNLTDGWDMRQELFASDAAKWSAFGTSVDVGENWIVVGSPFARPNGDVTQGAAYVFDRGTLEQTERLVASDGTFGDDFGYAVAVDGDLLAVSAIRDDTAGRDSGSVYTYAHTSSWSETGKLSDLGQQDGACFGISLSASDGTLVVGAFLHDNDPDTGIAYTFQFGANGATDPIALTPPNAEANGRFGTSVAVNDNVVFVVGRIEGRMMRALRFSERQLRMLLQSNWSLSSRVRKSRTVSLEQP